MEEQEDLIVKELKEEIQRLNELIEKQKDTKCIDKKVYKDKTHHYLSFDNCKKRVGDWQYVKVGDIVRYDYDFNYYTSKATEERRDGATFEIIKENTIDNPGDKQIRFIGRFGRMYY